MTVLRLDQALIAEWIRPGSRVLDLGCGDGALLAELRRRSGVTGYGLEIDPDNILRCIEAGVNVIQTNLDRGLGDFDDQSFDYVIMTQTIQAVRYPLRLLTEILRIGREGVVTFPNMGHWRCRLQLSLGKMPVTRHLPNTWFETPNIHMCTIDDFEDLCAAESIEILQRTTVDAEHRASLGMRLLPNFLGKIAIYRLRRTSAAAGVRKAAASKAASAQP